MSFENEMKVRFGGFWNSLVLLFVIIVCLRFSSLELADQGLWDRVHCALHLFFGCIATGILLGILRIFLGFSNDTYTRAPASVNFATGLKYGITTGGLLIFVVGILQLDNFLGAFQPMVNAILAKLLAIIA